MRSCWLALVLVVLGAHHNFTQAQDIASAESEFVSPLTDITYEVILLVESDDQHRRPYAGPAREGLTKNGYARLVVAGSATSLVTIGKKSDVLGNSRYGSFSVSATVLNTTEENEVQVQFNMQTRNRSPISIETTARAPLDRWFLVGATESRSGQPKHAIDGQRAVVVMRVTNGALLLD